MPGGYVGVDVFFTISGFLIFGIIRQQLDASTFSYRKLYTRRLLRLLPAMLVVTAATVAASLALLLLN
jgi:peptidoglycan/LPS O-acetylase OafA/YrhL